MADAPSTASVPQTVSLKAVLTPAAKKRITEFLNSFESFEPMLGLLYGDLDGVVAGEPSWSMTAYDPRTVEDTVEMYASFGAVVRYELDGFQVLIPQMAHVADLEGTKLDFVDNRIRPVKGAGG